MANNLLDICVLTYKREDLLTRCLDSIAREVQNIDESYKVFVLDNGSDPTMKIKHEGVEIQRKRISPNIGFPGGANAVMNIGNAPLILFLSDDIELQQGAINSLLQVMDDGNIGLCGLKLLFPPDSSDPTRPAGRVQHIGHAVDIRGNIIHPCIGWSDDNPKTCVSGERFSVTGAAFIVRRNLWKRVGGFDEVYAPGTYEDTDLALKIRTTGAKIYLDANAKAWHHVGGSQYQFPLGRNKDIFNSRWRSQGLIVWDEWLRW